MSLFISQSYKGSIFLSLKQPKCNTCIVLVLGFEAPPMTSIWPMPLLRGGGPAFGRWEPEPPYLLLSFTMATGILLGVLPKG